LGPGDVQRPGAAASDITRFNLVFDVKGTVPTDPFTFGAWQFLFGFADGATTAPSRDLIGSNTLAMGWATVQRPEASGSITAPGTLSASYDILSFDTTRFTALLHLDIHGPSASISFASQLLAGMSNGVIDFSKTARLGVDAPAGTSFTSESGLFLAGPQAVPAPAGVGLLCVGLVGLAVARRGRLASAEAASQRGA